MPYTTHRTRGVIDALLEAEYGKTYTEVNATITKSIVFLFSEMKLSVETIAEKLGLEVAEVLKILRQQKLTKRRK